jgi:hypothetical protein
MEGGQLMAAMMMLMGAIVTHEREAFENLLFVCAH